MIFNFMNSTVAPVPMIVRSPPRNQQPIDTQVIPDAVKPPLPIESDHSEPDEEESVKPECPSHEEVGAVQLTVPTKLAAAADRTVLWRFAISDPISFATSEVIDFDGLNSIDAIFQRDVVSNLSFDCASAALIGSDSFRALGQFIVRDPQLFMNVVDPISRQFLHNLQLPIHSNLIGDGIANQLMSDRALDRARAAVLRLNTFPRGLESFTAREPKSFVSWRLSNKIVLTMISRISCPMSSNVIDDAITNELIAPAGFESALKFGLSIASLENFVLSEPKSLLIVHDLFYQNALPIAVNVADQTVLNEIVLTDLLDNVFVTDCSWHRPLRMFSDRDPGSYVPDSFCSDLLNGFVDDFFIPLDSNTVDQFTVDRLVLRTFARLFDLNFPCAQICFDQIYLPLQIERNTALVVRSDLFKSLVLPVTPNVPDHNALEFISARFLRFLSPPFPSCNIGPLREFSLQLPSVPEQAVDFDGIVAQVFSDIGVLADALPWPSTHRLMQFDLRPRLPVSKRHTPSSPLRDVIVNILLQCYDEDQPEFVDSDNEFEAKWLSASTDTAQSAPEAEESPDRTSEDQEADQREEYAEQILKEQLDIDTESGDLNASDEEEWEYEEEEEEEEECPWETDAG
jgi:hypothetical protein